MKQTPLFKEHQDRGAEMAAIDGWLLPTHFEPQRARDALQSSAVVVDLCGLGTVHLSGPDARRFCNGMFTNNIRDLEPGAGNRSAMCDDRGRILGLLDLYCTGDDAFLGVLEGVTVEWFEQRYERYIVFDDVQMEVFADAPWVLSLQGPSAGGILKTLGLPVPPEDHGHAVISAESGPGEVRICRKDRTGLGGFDLLLPDEAVSPTWAALCHAGAVPMGSEGMDTARILAGRAQWPTDGTEKSLVHELRIEGEVCNFNKGCYLGQEVINRIDVKGQVAKRLTGLVLEEDALPPVGAEVRLNDAVVGRVSSATRHGDRVVALAVLRRAAWDPDHQVQIAAGERSVAAKTAELPFEC